MLCDNGVIHLIDKAAIKRYHKRVDARLADRGIVFDGNRWEEDKHPRGKDGKFTSGSGNSEGVKEKREEKRESGAKEEKTSSLKMNTTKSSNEYVQKLSDAKKSLPESQAPWRVTGYEEGLEFEKEHPGAKMYHTDGGSTIAVTPDGDIVGVCHHEGDPVRGKELLRYAIENGGKKLDAYEGLFGFYTKCGFEPVSWCEWNEEYAPKGWIKGRDNPEHIIFYKYTGNKSKYNSADEFFSAVKASSDYGTAQGFRDKNI